MTEHDKICMQINEYLNIKSKTNKLIHFHSPNEGRCSVQYRVKQKRLGVLAGVPDFGIIKNALWVEVKHGKDKLNDNQKLFFEMAKCKGHDDICVVSSFDDFVREYERYCEK